MNILDRILPWRRQIKNLHGLAKRLNADCQELADKLEFNVNANSCMAFKLAEATYVLRLLVDTTGFRDKFWHEYGAYPDLIPVAKERRELLARIEEVLRPTSKELQS